MLSRRASSETASRSREHTASSEALGLPSTAAWIAVFAVLVYVPILLMHVGKVESDTKQYLYLDPGRLLNRVATIWDPSVGLGTVSHQSLGYLFPSGPFYWLAETLLRLPAWVAQRLWLATIIFLAGLGVRYMLRTIGVRGAGVPVAMLVYAFSPYVVQYAGIYSVFLGPWAALPWWIGFAARGVRRGGWKYPALFAITVQLVGTLNATALLLATFGPALWLLHELLVTREVSLRQAFRLTWRTALLTVLTSLWWLVGLAVEGKYGVNLLRFTETLQTVAATALPVEFLRGLGFWFFYGRDTVGPWEDGLRAYTRTFVIFAGIAIPAFALLGAAVVRWRHSVYFVALILVGLTISVGAAPYDNPSIFGALWKVFTASSNTGMALRNSGRATPLIMLGIASLVGVGVGAVFTKLQSIDRSRFATAVVAGVIILCAINAAGAWGGHYYNTYLERNEQIPGYWTQVIAALKAKPNDTRVLALPGSDFASYLWGDTRDPIEPGLMDRPYVAREIVALGTPPSINLLRALDTPLQAGLFEPNALAPIARLMGVGDVLLRNDLETDRWGVVSAGEVWRTFSKQQPAGLSALTTYGDGTKLPALVYPDYGDPSVPDAAQTDPPPVAVMSVKDPLAIIRTKSTDAPLVVDGDGVGLVNVAAAGLLDARRLVLYSASYQQDPQFLRDLPANSVLVVTDSNRSRGERWSRMFNNYGYTQQAGEKALVPNPFDQPLDTFPNITDDARTVTTMRGVKSVTATTYGDRILGFTPGQRPSRVLDGDTNTAWTVDGGLPVGRERLRIELTHPITTDRVRLVQLLGAEQARWITGVNLRFDDKSSVDVALDLASRKKAGQDVLFPRRAFSTIEIEITSIHDTKSLFRTKSNAVGFAEVGLADDTVKTPVRVDESARLPRDLLDALGAQSLQHPLAVVISRDVMDDTSQQRQFSLPTARTFNVSGTATVSLNAKDATIDQLVGLPDAQSGGVTAASKHSFGRPVARASSAIDDNLATAWNTPVGAKPPNEYIQIATSKRVTFDHLDLAYVVDGRHSTPTQIKVSSDDGTSRLVDLPPRAAKPDPAGAVQGRVTFPAISGKSFRFVVTRYTALRRNDGLMPIGIAELGIPGVHVPAAARALPSACTDDLVRVDGKPFPVRVSGTSADALAQQPLTIEPCDASTTLTLGAGPHEIDSPVNPNGRSAVDLTHLVLTSGPGGSAVAPSALAKFSPASTDPAPELHVVKEGRASLTVRVDPTSAPFWFELGQSNNRGWTAKADGRDLGPAQLVDGYANGWRVSPSTPGKPITITLDWTPQRAVWKAMLVSMAAGLLCIGIALFALVGRRRRLGEPADAGLGPRLSERMFAGLPPRSGRSNWIVIVASGGLAALLVRPWAGVLVAVFVYVALRRRRWRVALRFAPGVIMLGVAIGVSGAQLIRRYPQRFEWPTFFDWARYPTWIAVVLLVAGSLASYVNPEDLDDEDADSGRSESETTNANQAATNHE